MIAHLTLAFMLRMVAGEAWAEELQRGALVRKAHGEPSVFSTIADNVSEISRSTWERSTETFASWSQSSWEPTSTAAPSSEGTTSLADVGAHGRAPAPRSRAVRGSASAVPPLPQPPSGLAPLSPGFGIPPWRLLSVPDEPDNVDPADILSTIAADFTLAYAYDACDLVSPWRVYDPADIPGSDLTAVDHRIGFWLKGTDPDPLAVSGTEPAETSIRLCPGWNLIGYPLAQDRPVLAALSSIIGKFLRVYGFDPDDEVEPWKVYDVAVPDWANTLRTMERGRGYWIYALEETTLIMRNVGPPPEVAITSPADGAVVTFLTDIVGTVRSDLLARWELSYRPAAGTSFTSFATGTTPVLDDVLDTFDPTLLVNGLYQLQLEATDFIGQSTATTIHVVVEGNAKIGASVLSFIDLDVPLAGVPIQLVRSYDSRNKRTGDFGVGWTLDLRDVRLDESGTTGLDWQGTRAGPIIPNYCIEPTLNHVVTIAFIDGTVLRFLPTPEPRCQLAAPPSVVTITYEPLPGTLGSLRPLDQNEQAFVSGSFPGPVELWDLETVQPHDPNLYELTMHDGRVLVIDQDVGLVSITDRNGNRLTVSQDGITHSSGIGIQFLRDSSSGLITEVRDPAGESIRYEYDDESNLVSVVDRVDRAMGFGYDTNHNLTQIQAPDGRRPVIQEYDDRGRLIAVVDSDNNRIAYDHQLDDRQEVVTDRNGDITVYNYDLRGNITAVTDPLGNVTRYEYDERDNVTKEIDALGNTQTRVFDGADNLIRQTDALGNVTSWSYDQFGLVLTITDPKGNVTRNEYNGAGNLIRTIDPLGNELRNEYDEVGNLRRTINAAGNEETFEYDSRSNLVRQVDAAGRETTFVYDSNARLLRQTARRTLSDGTTETVTSSREWDADGRLLKETDPLGYTVEWVYNNFGAIDQIKDKNGNITRYQYDQVGRLTKIVYPDDTAEEFSYDQTGRQRTSTDRNANVTEIVPDKVDRPKMTIYADGSFTTTEYDAVGRPVATTDENGNVSHLAYDTASHLIREINALGHVTTFQYDANGNRTALIDALGRSTTYHYDANDRLTHIDFPDDTSKSLVYDPLGRVISDTDQAGLTTQLRYSPTGELLEVIDAAGNSTTYEYDELGLLATITDAENRRTRFEHDPLGRLKRRTSPGGHAESMTYDGNGNPLTLTDPNGEIITFKYDTSNRLVKKTYSRSGQPPVNLTYLPAGQKSSMTDGTGTTTFDYDERDRLIRVTSPDGKSVEYAYDPGGNLDLVTGSATRTAYDYDALNRLTSVTDLNGNTTLYEYDALGNTTRISYANGTEARYGYDSLSRVTSIEHRDSSDLVISKFLYTLDFLGRRVKVEDANGRIVEYTYDTVSKLIRETVRDATNSDPPSEISYSYDRVGNRITKSVEGTLTTYSYDDDDRLLSYTARAAGSTFAYDANGNLISQSGPEGTMSYVWDQENKLFSVAVDTTSVQESIGYSYDDEGNLVARVADGATVRFLVDRNREISEIIEEYDGSGQTLQTYTLGSSRINQETVADGALRYYHYDAQESVRHLTDADGVAADAYDYDAFGVLLAASGTSENRFRYAGQQVDPATGLYFLRARHLDTGIGRFLSADSFAGFLTSPITLNRYIYANSDPVNNLDPTGHGISLNELLTVLSIISIVVRTAMGNFNPFKSWWDAFELFLLLLPFAGAVARWLWRFASGLRNILRFERAAMSVQQAMAGLQRWSLIRINNFKGAQFEGLVRDLLGFFKYVPGLRLSKETFRIGRLGNIPAGRVIPDFVARIGQRLIAVGDAKLVAGPVWSAGSRQAARLIQLASGSTTRTIIVFGRWSSTIPPQIRNRAAQQGVKFILFRFPI